MSLVNHAVQDRVGVITIDNPPVNALSRGVPEGVLAAIHELEKDVSVDAIVIIGAGRTFVAGADINEFVEAAAGRAPMPVLHPTFDAIEQCAKRVVVAIHGTALGGGLELAMAGHYRIATADALVGQPEVKIGLIPGAGGTQRLPRLAGIAKAAEMCAFGEPIGAPQALESGIVDHIVDGDLLDAAKQFALGRVGQQTNRTRDRQGRLQSVDLSELRSRIEKTRPHQIAPLLAIDAVELTATVPFEEGIHREAEMFDRCVHSEQSRALIHAFFAEREVSKIPGVPKDTPVYPIRQAAVVGAGTMGGGIAMALANAGIPVRLKETDQSALDRGIATIRKNYERSLKNGKLTSDALNRRMALITPQVGWDGFEHADIIIEAVFESMALKKQIFAELDKFAKPDCILATNTSTLDIDAIAAATSRPHMVIGTHFFSPANVMRLLEIVRGRETSKSVISTAMAFAKTLKKVGVVVGNGFGFVGNRMFFPYFNEAQFLVEEGATPEQVDKALTDFGMAMGPFAVADLSGIDVFWRIEHEYAWPADKRRPVGIERLYAAGRYGQKTGAGWYRYDENRKPTPDPSVAAMIQSQHQAFPDEEILRRCLFALIDEGARVLEEGIAARAGDIDVIYLTGYGFPAYRGGPMFYGRTRGWATSLYS